jgi:hypothetical protein
MDIMRWLFDTTPCVALRFVHVSSSEWSTCRTQVCPRVALRFVHVSFLVGPPFHFWLGHTFDSGCDTWLLLNAPRVSFQFHCQYTYNSHETGISAYITYSYDTRHIIDDTNMFWTRKTIMFTDDTTMFTDDIIMFREDTYD